MPPGGIAYAFLKYFIFRNKKKFDFITSLVLFQKAKILALRVKKL